MDEEFIAKTIVTEEDRCLEEILAKVDKNALVIFDCDDVLMRYTDAVFSPKNVGIYEQGLKYLSEKVGLAKTEEYILAIRKQLNFQLVNDNWLKIIQTMQAKGVKVLVLTAHWTGSYYDLKHAEDTRKEELHKLGFDFKKSWKNVDDIVFEEFPTVMPGNSLTRYPTFSDGIIFSCNAKKGKVLKEFLRKIPYKFNKVIFVDDKMHNIKSMEESCNEMRISFIGVNYTKVAETDDRRVSFQEVQPIIDEFIKTKRWRSSHSLK